MSQFDASYMITLNIADASSDGRSEFIRGKKFSSAHKSKISTDRNKCVLAFVIYSPKMLSADNRNGGGLCFKWKSGG